MSRQAGNRIYLTDLWTSGHEMKTSGVNPCAEKHPPGRVVLHNDVSRQQSGD